MSEYIVPNLILTFALVASIITFFYCLNFKSNKVYGYFKRKEYFNTFKSGIPFLSSLLVGLLAIVISNSLHDKIEFSSSPSVADPSETLYTVHYKPSPSPISTPRTDHLYIDLEQNLIVLAEDDGEIVAPNEFQGQSISSNPSFTKIEEDIVVETEEQYNALMESYEKL